MGEEPDEGVRPAELIAAISLATDIGMAQPLETGLAVCLVAVELAGRLGYGPELRQRTFHLALLQHIGCTVASAPVAAVLGDEMVMRSHAATLDFADQAAMFRFLLAHIGRVFAADCENVSPYGTTRGIEALRQMGEAFRAAAPDSRLEARSTWESGGTVIVEGTHTGTHTGSLAGPGGVVPPTGRAFTLPYVDIFQARDGKFVSHRIYWDNATFLAQLGLLPEPAPAGS